MPEPGVQKPERPAAAPTTASLDTGTEDPAARKQPATASDELLSTLLFLNFDRFFRPAFRPALAVPLRTPPVETSPGGEGGRGGGTEA